MGGLLGGAMGDALELVQNAKAKEAGQFTRAQFRSWKREMKALAYRKAALAGGGKRECARRSRAAA